MIDTRKLFCDCCSEEIKGKPYARLSSKEPLIKKTKKGEERERLVTKRYEFCTEGCLKKFVAGEDKK